MLKPRRVLTIGLTALVLLNAESNWPGWRGPLSNGVSDEKNLPTEWTPDSHILWKTELPGRGNSSPVIWGDRIFLTAESEGDMVEGIQPPLHKLRGQPFRHPDSTAADRIHKLLVMALDRKTGSIVWQKVAYEGLVYDEHHKKGNHAAPTAVTDGKLIYFYFGAGGLFAYDFDGKQIWNMNPGKLGTIGMGPGTSPVLDADRVFLQCDVEEGEGSYVIALDKKSGKTLWRKERTEKVSWATPVLMKLESGGVELLTSGLDAVIAYEPATGKILWKSAGVGGNAVPSMVYTQGIAVFTAGYPDKHTIAIKPGGSGDVKPLWEYNKGSGYVPSPIAYGDYVYLISDKGILTCLDAKTGEVKYANGRVPVPATFSASPIAFDGKILLTSEDGDTFVVKAGPVHEVLGRNSVGEAVYASPAVAQGTIFIRGAKHLFAIR